MVRGVWPLCCLVPPGICVIAIMVVVFRYLIFRVTLACYRFFKMNRSNDILMCAGVRFLEFSFLQMNSHWHTGFQKFCLDLIAWHVSRASLFFVHCWHWYIIKSNPLHRFLEHFIFSNLFGRFLYWTVISRINGSISFVGDPWRSLLE